MSKSEEIFNKYADHYDLKYGSVDLYSESLDQFLGSLKQNANLLELACGPGNLTRYLIAKRPDLNILGLDIAKNMIDLARINNPGANFLRMDCRYISRIAKKFDAILAGFLLPYLNADEASKLIRSANSLLNNHGLLYLSTMEAGKTDSGLQESSLTEQDTLYTHYHNLDFLKLNLEKSHFEIRTSEYLDNPNNAEEIRDLLLIAVKSGN